MVCPVDAIFDNHGVVTVMLKKKQRPIAFVDELACTGCDKCAEHCPFDCLALEETSDPQSPFFAVMRVEEPKCTGCLECVKACPYDAIFVFVFRRDQVPDWLRANIGVLPGKKPALPPAAPSPRPSPHPEPEP